jgi:hypothetical protein
VITFDKDLNGDALDAGDFAVFAGATPLGIDHVVEENEAPFVDVYLDPTVETPTRVTFNGGPPTIIPSDPPFAPAAAFDLVIPFP